MANGTQQAGQKPSELDIPDFVPVKTAIKAFDREVTKQVSESTARKLQSGENPNAILAQILQTFKAPSQQTPEQQKAGTNALLERITSLAEQPVETGVKAGLIPSLIKTGEFKRIPQTRQRGFDDAAKIVELELKQQAQQQSIETGQIDFARKIQQLIASTPEGIASGEEAKARGQARAQEVKSAQKTEENYRIAQDKLKLTMKKFTEAAQETYRITGGLTKGTGRIGGTVTAFLGAIGKNPKVKAFQGDLVETSTAIAKIAAPSAKVGPDLIKLFKKTLPDIGFFITSTDQEAREQIITSITNGFINYMATHPEESEGANLDLFEAQMRQVVNAFADTGETIFQEATGKPQEGTPGTVATGVQVPALSTGEKSAAELELEQINAELQALEGGQ